MKIQEPITEMMKDGKIKYEKFREKGKYQITLLGQKKVKPDRILYSQEVYSQKYNLYGIIDIIYWIRGKGYIVDIKDSDTRQIIRDHLYQAVAYSIMAEETFKTSIHEVQLYYIRSGKWITRRVTSNLRKFINRVLGNINRILYDNYIPTIKSSKKCSSCWYRKICSSSISKENREKRKVRRKILKL